MANKMALTESQIIMETLLYYTRLAADLAGYMEKHMGRFRGDWDQIRHDLTNAAVTIEGLLCEIEEVTANVVFPA